MKLYNILVNGETHLAIEGVNGIVDATAAGCALCMDEIIAGADTGALKAIAQDAALPVIETPVYANILNSDRKLLCVGLNYRAHAEGAKMTDQVKGNPILFSKFANALAPAGAEVVLPPWEVSYDYEAELVVVMGKKAHDVSVEEAMDYVFGYSCGNDLSCREAQMRSGQWLIGKTMPGFGPAGPCIVTADSLDPVKGIQVQSYVNGELRQNGNTTEMIFSIADIISYASKYIDLEPGDLIYTGTPSGVALEDDPSRSRWLKPGDVVDVVIEGIGTMTNKMI